MSEESKSNTQIIWNPGVAAVLSFFVPGLGQLYKRELLRAALWFAFAVIGYVCLVIPGLIIHIACIVNALKAEPGAKIKVEI